MTIEPLHTKLTWLKSSNKRKEKQKTSSKQKKKTKENKRKKEIFHRNFIAQFNYRWNQQRTNDSFVEFVSLDVILPSRIVIILNIIEANTPRLLKIKMNFALFPANSESIRILCRFVDHTTRLYFDLNCFPIALK